MIAVFWEMALCRLIEIDPSIRGAYCLYRYGDDAGSKHLRNVGKFLRD
jgi:hypothetical protein